MKIIDSFYSRINLGKQNNEHLETQTNLLEQEKIYTKKPALTTDGAPRQSLL